MSAQEDFHQLKRQFVDPIQHDYEAIRPIVLFAETAAERSRQTGIDRTTIGDKARHFVIDGMLGLHDQRAEQSGRKGHVYPDAVAAYMLYVKQLYPPIHRDGFEGLEDQRTRPAHHPDDQLTLPFLKEVLDLQKESPRAGRFRLYGLLEQQRGEAPPSESTVGRAMAINRRLHGAPGPWRSARDEKEEVDGEPKHLPYRPLYRHHFWYVDIRYLVQLEGRWVYSTNLAIIDSVG